MVAKWRSDLRDVDPHLVNEMIRDKLQEMREKRPRDKGDMRFKQPGVGTAVVVFDDLTEKNRPADADVITTWK